ncbi:MAG: hypothetical protein ACREMG_07865 [Gemmatimonadales bacterium]
MRVLGVMVLLLFPWPAVAQTPASAAWRATPASLLKTTLRAVAAAQARYRAEHPTYASSTAQLNVRPEDGIRVEILTASSEGWQAKAVHPAQPGRSCVIFAGQLDHAEFPRTDGDREMAGEEGVPLCDRMR